MTEQEEYKARVPWKNGIYRFRSTTQFVIKILDEKMKMIPTGCVYLESKDDLLDGTIRYGSFGPTTEEVLTVVFIEIPI